MKVVDNKTNRKENKKSNNKHYLRPNLEVDNKKTITKPNLHQIKPKENTITYNLF